MVRFLGKGKGNRGSSSEDYNGYKKCNKSWFTRFNFGREKENSTATTRREVQARGTGKEDDDTQKFVVVVGSGDWRALFIGFDTTGLWGITS